MSSPLGIFIPLIVIFLILIYFRVPAIILFLSLFVGQLLSTQVGEYAESFGQEYLHINNYEYIQVTLLLAPTLLSILLLRFRVTKSKLPMEALSYVLIALMGLIFASDTLFSLKEVVSTIETQWNFDKSAILAVASVVILINAWLTYPKVHQKKHAKH